MRNIQRTLRHYYWFFTSFVKKNSKLLIVSVVLSFFFIIFITNVFPFFSSVFFKKREKIGLIGKYELSNLPVSITSLVSNPIVAVGKTGSLQPVLANSWEIAEDGKIYRFHIKTDLFWQDKEPFTASDIDIKLEGVTKKVIDEKTIEFHLTHPLSTFPIYLTKPIIKDTLVGVAGLYDMKSYKTDKYGYLTSIHLSPNDKEMPYKIYRFYRNEDDLISSYKRGETNKIFSSKKSIVDIFKAWKNTKVSKDVDFSNALTLFFNTKHQLLSEKDVRKAFAYATPKFEEFGIKAFGPIPPISWSYLEDIKKYQYNPDKSASIFEKVKTATDSAELDLYTFYDYISIAEELKESYEEMGAKINLRVLSYKPEKFDMFLTMWNPPSDPDQYYFWHSTQEKDNITAYENVKVDKLLEDGRSITNVDKRIEIYNDFQKIIVEELPAYFLFYPYVYTIERK